MAINRYCMDRYFWLKFYITRHTDSDKLQSVAEGSPTLLNKYSNQQNNLTLTMGSCSGQTLPLLYYLSILILYSVSNNNSMTLIFANVDRILPNPFN